MPEQTRPTPEDFNEFVQKPDAAGRNYVYGVDESGDAHRLSHGAVLEAHGYSEAEAKDNTADHVADEPSLHQMQQDNMRRFGDALAEATEKQATDLEAHYVSAALEGKEEGHALHTDDIKSMRTETNPDNTAVADAAKEVESLQKRLDSGLLRSAEAESVRKDIADLKEIQAEYQNGAQQRSDDLRDLINAEAQEQVNDQLDPLAFWAKQESGDKVAEEKAAPAVAADQADVPEAPADEPEVEKPSTEAPEADPVAEKDFTAENDELKRLTSEYHQAVLAGENKKADELGARIDKLANGVLDGDERVSDKPADDETEDPAATESEAQDDKEERLKNLKQAYSELQQKIQEAKESNDQQALAAAAMELGELVEKAARETGTPEEEIKSKKRNVVYEQTGIDIGQDEPEDKPAPADKPEAKPSPEAGTNEQTRKTLRDRWKLLKDAGNSALAGNYSGSRDALREFATRNPESNQSRDKKFWTKVGIGVTAVTLATVGAIAALRDDKVEVPSWVPEGQEDAYRTFDKADVNAGVTRDIIGTAEGRANFIKQSEWVSEQVESGRDPAAVEAELLKYYQAVEDSEESDS